MKIRVGVVGIGSMGHGIVHVVQRNNDMEVVAVSDRNLPKLNKIRPTLSKDALISTDIMDVIDAKPDVLVEATGSVLEAALFIKKSLENKIHVIALNAEVDQVYGKLFNKIAKSNGVLYSSDAGDQNGVLSRLITEISSMGFQIVLAGNNKGFLDLYANPDTIREEAAIRRLSLKQCTSFTDGTKLAIEMALVANAFNLDILKTGMVGPKVENIYQALNIYNLKKAREMGGVVDYVVGACPGGSVFVIGFSNDPEDKFYMNYYKMGNGPYYIFVRPYHLCHFETPFAIRKMVKNNEPILVQNRRVLEVGARAKKNLVSGTKLDGIGGYHLYGTLEKLGRIPIALLKGTVLINKKKRDEPIEWHDIEFKNCDPRMELWEEQKTLSNNANKLGGV